jgi:hypothetical protein
MPKFPEPPPRGQMAKRLPPDVSALTKGTIIWRIYSQGGVHPVVWNQFRHWSPALNMRFDHHRSPPHHQARASLYGTLRVYTCFAEVFQDTRTIERSRNRLWLVGFALARDVSLLDLTGRWPTKAGASMAVNSGRRDRARRWSLRIYEDYPGIEGLYYPSSMDSNQPAMSFTSGPRTPCLPEPPFTARSRTPA